MSGAGVRESPINRFNTHIIPVEFEYYEPKTLREALELLAKWGRDAKVLAGGTDLLVQMKIRKVEPKCLINIKRIPGLDFIKEGDESLRIGAATKLRKIGKSEVVRRRFPALYEAVREMASVQIKNMATIGGNLCNASPAADTAPPLMVYGAKLKLVSLEGERIVPIEEFFTGPGETVLKPGELLAEILIPYQPESTGSSFIKVSRTSMDLAKVNVAVRLTLSGETMSRVRIALGAVAPTPMRAREAERHLEGKPPSESDFKRAGEIAAGEIKPITDLRSTAWYRREVTKVIVADALTRALSRAKGEVGA